MSIPHTYTYIYVCAVHHTIYESWHAFKISLLQILNHSWVCSTPSLASRGAANVASEWNLLIKEPFRATGCSEWKRASPRAVIKSIGDEKKANRISYTWMRELIDTDVSKDAALLGGGGDDSHPPPNLVSLRHLPRAFTSRQIFNSPALLASSRQRCLWSRIPESLSFRNQLLSLIDELRNENFFFPENVKAWA